MKADKDLLRRVIVALESGRDVDVNTLLQSELAPVPKSLATLDRSLREAGKSDLGIILQGNVCKSQMPISRSQTCTIIDGMAAVQSFANCSVKNSIKGGTRDKRKEKHRAQGLGAMWITEIRELETGKGLSF